MLPVVGPPPPILRELPAAQVEEAEAEGRLELAERPLRGVGDAECLLRRSQGRLELAELGERPDEERMRADRDEAVGVRRQPFLGQGFVESDSSPQRFIRHPDLIKGVLRRHFCFGQDQGDRLPGKDHPVAGQ